MVGKARVNGSRREPGKTNGPRSRPYGEPAGARIPVPCTRAALPRGYAAVLNEIKQRIRTRHVRIVLRASAELVLLYWDIGHLILERQRRAGWGARVIDRLAADLARAFPDLRGFSPRNLKYMRAFAAAWRDEAIVQQLAAQLPWSHHCVLLDRVGDASARLWYVRQGLEHGWSRKVLAIQIDSGLYKRKGKAITNFATTLPSEDSDLAQQCLKDSYVFDFLGPHELRRERDGEQALVEHIQRFLLELGAGFAFVGRQVPLEVGDQDFRIDLLFYHLKLRCYVVIELRVGPFEPSFVGQMNLYLSAVDDLLRHRDNRATIGLLLCRTKNRFVVEYALRDLGKPVGVAQWQTKIVKSLPKALRSSLPSVEELERELRRPSKKR